MTTTVYLTALSISHDKLTAIDLTAGTVGTLSTTGEAVRSAVQSAFDLIYAIDPGLTSWLACRAPTMQIQLAADVEHQLNGMVFATAGEREGMRDRLTDTYKAGLTLITEYTRKYSAIGATIAGNVGSALADFDAAIAAFSGPAAQKAAALTARQKLFEVGVAMGLIPSLYDSLADPGVVPPLCQRSWIPFLLANRW